jgi:cell division protein ZapA (FtsZ GTPase activity inhibitor)
MPASDPFAQDLDPLAQLRHYIGVLRRGWFTVFTLATLGLLVGVSLFFFLPKEYTSTAKVLLRGAWMFDKPGELHSLDRVPMNIRAKLLEDELRSTAWVTAVLDKLEWPDWATAKKQGTTSSVVTSIKKGIDVQLRTGETGERLVFINFSYSDRVRARDFTRELRDHWLFQVQDAYETALDTEVNERREALADKEKDLKRSRKEMQEFEQRHGVSVLFVGQHRAARRDQLTQRLDQLLGEITRLEAEYDELETSLAEVGPDGILLLPQYLAEIREVENEAFQSAVTSVATINAEIENLKLRSYTDKHPSMVQLNRRLKEAISALQEGDVPESVAFAGTPQANPEYQLVQRDLLQLRVKIRASTEEQARLQKEVQQVEEEMSTLPIITAELDRQRREIATLQTIVDDARIALQKPLDIQNSLRRHGPERLKPYSHLEQPKAAPSAEAAVGWIALGASVLIGLSLALALLFGRELVKTSINSAEQARRVLQLPVLGEVASIQTDIEARRARLQRSLQIAASLTLLVGFGATIYVCLNHSEMLPVALVEWAAGIREGLS